jgi:hypothetical protein
MTQDRGVISPLQFPGHGPTETPALQADSAKQNQAGGYRPNATNQQVTLSPGNGNSAADASRQLPSLAGNNVNQLKAANGISPQTLAELQPTYATPI